MVSMLEWSYSCSTSTTSRPLYWPQCGHTRCGSLGSWQFGHSERPAGFSASCARRVWVRWWECLRFGFGIYLPQSISFRIARSTSSRPLRTQIPERRPAIVGFLNLTIAGRLPAILPTDRADARAVFAAHSPHRQGQQHLFPEDILQFQAGSLVETDLR